jgi:predicted RNase H-like nuclease (RuvC/YqgF family)
MNHLAALEELENKRNREKKRVEQLESDLKTALERAEKSEAHVKQLEGINQLLLEPPSTDEIVLELRNRIKTLRKDLREEREELSELRRRIDGAAEITAEYFGDFVCWTPTFDEPTELKLNMQPGETRTFKLLEVKP